MQFSLALLLLFLVSIGFKLHHAPHLLLPQWRCVVVSILFLPPFFISFLEFSVFAPLFAFFPCYSQSVDILCLGFIAGMNTTELTIKLNEGIIVAIFRIWSHWCVCFIDCADLVSPLPSPTYEVFCKWRYRSGRYQMKSLLLGACGYNIDAVGVQSKLLTVLYCWHWGGDLALSKLLMDLKKTLGKRHNTRHWQGLHRWTRRAT